MKRVGNLIDRIVDWDDLLLAFYKASKGKQCSKDVISYKLKLRDNLQLLKRQILTGQVSVGKYHFFKIFDPKERTICAASFDERVLHHAIMNICHPIFERTLIYDTYATRPGKGIYKALEKVLTQFSHYKYVAKLDVRKFFDNISHDKLKLFLKTKFKDPLLLHIFYQILDSYAVKRGYGLPIGNLLSQYFANFYLSNLDHFIKESLHIKEYVRYMDDMLLLSNDKTVLTMNINAIMSYLEHIDLYLKPIVLQKVEYGISFLGYKIFPHKILLNNTSKRRFTKKALTYQSRLIEAEWNEREYRQHIEPLLSFCCHAYSKKYRKGVFEGSNRVLRGGSWNNNAVNCRVSNRNNNNPDNRNNNNGFRLVLAQEADRMIYY